MKTVYSDLQRGHAGGTEMIGGRLQPAVESPARAQRILDRIAGCGLGPVVAPRSFDDEPILAVHERQYVEFLRGLWAQWCAVEGANGCARPHVFPIRGLRAHVPESIHGKLGYYCFDIDTPVVAGTWAAARSAADVALSAQALIHSGAPAAFALCRPPGHHAAAAMFGGYCFLNNAAIAAQAFVAGGAARVAVLDVDYHHGNGTQSIFYARRDVLFCSLHADPETDYPHFAGYADEAGAGDGEGCNLNLPLPRGTRWSRYSKALDRALRRIRSHGAEAVVVSLGVDTYREDPISRFRFRQDDFVRLGESIGGLRVPTLFVMEGGYAVADIGVNVVNTLTGFEQA